MSKSTDKSVAHSGKMGSLEEMGSLHDEDCFAELKSRYQACLLLQILPRASLASGLADSLYRLEIQGTVPPWTLTRICCILGCTMNSKFQVD